MDEEDLELFSSPKIFVARYGFRGTKPGGVIGDPVMLTNIGGVFSRGYLKPAKYAKSRSHRIRNQRKLDADTSLGEEYIESLVRGKYVLVRLHQGVENPKTLYFEPVFAIAQEDYATTLAGEPMLTRMQGEIITHLPIIFRDYDADEGIGFMVNTEPGAPNYYRSIYVRGATQNIIASRVLATKITSSHILGEILL
tara:strand:+ start:2663 stop:3250 length:588 start_codon:yes stop_codon:yes gene_type:complete